MPRLAISPAGISRKSRWRGATRKERRPHEPTLLPLVAAAFARNLGGDRLLAPPGDARLLQARFLFHRPVLEDDRFLDPDPCRGRRDDARDRCSADRYLDRMATFRGGHRRGARGPKRSGVAGG